MIPAKSMNFNMNTVMTHMAYGEYASQSLKKISEEAQQLELKLSRFQAKSEISRINKGAGKRQVEISDSTFEILSLAFELSCLSGGLFDITIAPLLNLWKDGRSRLTPPDEKMLIKARSFVDFNGLKLNPCGRTAKLIKKGQSIDLGGIGKGFAADRFIEIFHKYEVTSAFTNIGGNVAVLGGKEDGSPWRVGIKHPRRDKELIGVISIRDKSVVTSGDYERYFIAADGKRYHHILDPRTGAPAESGIVSVTVVTDKSMVADALSTALFIAGLKKGREILKKFPGTEAIFINSELLVFITPGLKGNFQGIEGAEVKIGE